MRGPLALAMKHQGQFGSEITSKARLMLPSQFRVEVDLVQGVFARQVASSFFSAAGSTGLTM